MTFAEQILSEIKAIDKKIERCISQLKTLDSRITKLDPNSEFENELLATPKEVKKDYHMIDSLEAEIIENPSRFAEAVYLRNKGMKGAAVAKSLGYKDSQHVYNLVHAAKVRGYLNVPSKGNYVVTDLFRELHPEKTSNLKSVN